MDIPKLRILCEMGIPDDIKGENKLNKRAKVIMLEIINEVFTSRSF